MAVWTDSFMPVPHPSCLMPQASEIIMIMVIILLLLLLLQLLSLISPHIIIVHVTLRQTRDKRGTIIISNVRIPQAGSMIY